MLTTGCAPPLSEDWCLHGMEWVGRQVFEKGYWKSSGPFASSCPAAVNVLGPSKTTARIDPRDLGLPCYYNNWTIIYVLEPELARAIRDCRITTIIGQ
jgi:hypothetical protein